MRARLFYIDGGVLGGCNPSTEGIYASVAEELPGGVIVPVHACIENHEFFTNNDAEWWALFLALRHLATLPIAEVTVIHSDSQLIVNQYTGRWQIQSESMARWNELAHLEAKRTAGRLVMRWVPREANVKRLGH